ncbi:aminoglycoside phosphotransferase family protein [Phreatobacter sp. AB_2022a]|uniref:aminoglycoside phosphotransferase family protein n=1 Tax=Phreatobacter sp. AB_2022a TaxID=3003134 RepID=UPI00228738CE|nr:aminoglycoside phosphotransferase family protein [Phreatobacter sp. AB_2022a]MCZ0733695.1 3'-kinase [Phreatobacter sp. AB_2022a]
MVLDGHLRSLVERWALAPDGEPIVTRSSRLLPVLQGGRPAMLKVATEPEEKWGAGLMVWWDGIGAARVLAHEGDAILIERATGSRSLADMARHGEDDRASRIICETVARLHAPRQAPPPDLVPLSVRFRALLSTGAGGMFARCADAARLLLAEPRDVVPLHGDVHHGNILDFGDRGWLAIDPKRLEGERGFDHANLFCNPDHAIALTPGRLARQADVVARAAHLERRRLLHWILAWAGLSAVWLIEDGATEHVAPTLRIAEIAAAEIARS